MQLRQLIQKIYDLYNENYESKIRNIPIGEAFVEVAAYFLERTCSVRSMDFEPTKGIDLIVKLENGNKYAVQVVEHIKSGEDLDEEAIEDFIRASKRYGIASAKRVLILFDCPLSNQEIEDFLKTGDVGIVMTEADMCKEDIDWQDCWRRIRRKN